MILASATVARIGTIVAFIASLTLTACGGGGNESGPSESLSVSPSNFTVTGPKDECAKGGPFVEVFVHGGTPPYRVSNTVPGAISLDKETIKNSGDSVLVWLGGDCLSSATIVFEDQFGRLGNFTISNIKGT